ncbi:ADP-ribosylation-containing protein [Dioscorea alata]|uniref:ADP-ribosylation-containing protein n=1 Tax=Dioscorea alata TaxID=55571 RepID=A0ACB7VE30_DIOAL|nr:ADP-ribosylation-containing protein [Dioscorea alata]
MMEGRRSQRRGERIPTVLWFTLKRSMHCKSEPSEVHDPKFGAKLGSIMTKRSVGRSGCSRSIANLKDVIHGSKRHFQRPTSCSPRSIGSSDFLNPISHEVILSDARCELRIVTSFGGCHESGTAAEVVGTLRPGTPGPGGHLGNFSYNPCGLRSRSTPRKSLQASLESKNGGVCCASSSSTARASVEGEEEKDNNSIGSSTSLICQKCGEVFAKWDGLESHHLSHHAVTELVEGDSSRKIVEIICRANWLKSESSCGRIERVLKVHNMQKTLSRFEEYREMVKLKAGKLPKKHPRCLADGNELLRFHGTTVSCYLGMNGSSSLCTSKNCNVCQILRHGFTTKKKTGPIGVFTTATSGRAFESIDLSEDDPSTRKALLVCRVIAGRVHKPLDNYQELVGQSVFDSLAGKVGPYANIEELYLLNPRALLPCFVVICKP